MEASDIKEGLRVWKAARDTKNPYLARISALPNLTEIISQKETELKELKTRGYAPISICERFERADMLEEYQSMYNLLCAESHSNKRALINRHVDITSGNYEMVFYKNDPDEKYEMYTDSAAGLLVGATLSIHEHFNSDVLDQVKQLKIQLDNIRAKYEK